MKFYILLLIAFGFIGFVCEWITRILIDYSLDWKEKIQELKLLLMFFVYGPACILISLFYLIPSMQKITLLPVMMLIGGVIASVFEFGFGYLFNIVLKLDIWNYTTQIKIGKKIIKLNIMGQVDLWHCLLWCILTIPVCYFYEIIKWLAR